MNNFTIYLEAIKNNNDNNYIKLKKADVKFILQKTYPDYKGLKFKVKIDTNIWFSNRDWSGGTHSDYKILKNTGGKLLIKTIPEFFLGDGIMSSDEKKIIPDDIMVVEHSFFCGKDLGIIIHISPSSIFLPQFTLDKK